MENVLLIVYLEGAGTFLNNHLQLLQNMLLPCKSREFIKFLTKTQIIQYRVNKLFKYGIKFNFILFVLFFLKL